MTIAGRPGRFDLDLAFDDFLGDVHYAFGGDVWVDGILRWLERALTAEAVTFIPGGEPLGGYLPRDVAYYRAARKFADLTGRDCKGLIDYILSA